MTKQRTLVVAVALFSAGAVLALDAAAQAKPEVLVKQRQAAMTMIGKYFGPLGAMARGKAAYNADVVKRNAGYLEVLAQLPWDGFHESTKGEKSAALPAVFEKSSEFKQGAERLQNEVAKLASVSKSGDESAVKSQIAAVGKACGGCHDNFREKR
ncbi:MAG TPA: cytochrome c [Burkholderiales bacterium]|nr:cytochrome c [Burkholderiales bacterium]